MDLLGKPQKGSGGKQGDKDNWTKAYDPFKTGEFICKSFDRAIRIAEFVNELNFDNKKSQNFIAALIKIDELKYDRNRMKFVINSNIHKFNHMTKPIRDYIYLMNEIYNHHLMRGDKSARIQFYDPREML